MTEIFSNKDQLNKHQDFYIMAIVQPFKKTCYINLWHGKTLKIYFKRKSRFKNVYINIYLCINISVFMYILHINTYKYSLYMKIQIIKMILILKEDNYYNYKQKKEWKYMLIYANMLIVIILNSQIVGGFIFFVYCAC